MPALQPHPVIDMKRLPPIVIILSLEVLAHPCRMELHWRVLALTRGMGLVLLNFWKIPNCYVASGSFTVQTASDPFLEA